ncbi:MAG: hypothetical protein HC834_09250 [Rhodospirillales bacterium]|nr:hypothetical protein [Rhodospirillales bacterium]
MILSLVFVAAAPAARREFQMAVDKLIYGISYQPDEVVSLFAARIPAAFERSSLVRIVRDEILPTLMVRQSALYLHSDEGDAEVVYEQAVPSGTPTGVELGRLSSWVKPLGNLNLSGDARFEWVRLVVPLATSDREVGLWLFGRRDPDDFYPRSDVELLANLGNQIGR